jgi:hypothetical protein
LAVLRASWFTGASRGNGLLVSSGYVWLPLCASSKQKATKKPAFLVLRPDLILREVSSFAHLFRFWDEGCN